MATASHAREHQTGPHIHKKIHPSTVTTATVTRGEAHKRIKHYHHDGTDQEKTREHHRPAGGETNIKAGSVSNERIEHSHAGVVGIGGGTTTEQRIVNGNSYTVKAPIQRSPTQNSETREGKDPTCDWPIVLPKTPLNSKQTLQ